jgi:two-component system sensor histidine kinase MprB
VLDRVVAQVAELGQLVASVTELARDESQPGPLREVALHEVVEAGLAGARRDWPQAVFTADLAPWLVTGSTESLQIAVRNLLDNAAKFGPAGARVEVRLRAGELTVRDHGPGIAPADLPHVFDRFYRAPPARGVPGSGLGLSIVRQVAERHGGTVRAEAAPGAGALIRLWLPGQDPWANPAPGAALAGSAP